MRTLYIISLLILSITTQAQQLHSTTKNAQYVIGVKKDGTIMVFGVQNLVYSWRTKIIKGGFVKGCDYYEHTYDERYEVIGAPQVIISQLYTIIAYASGWGSSLNALHWLNVNIPVPKGVPTGNKIFYLYNK